MKHVLFIAHPFPPHGGGGVQRTVKFLKYLSHFGWHTTVITGPEPEQAQDASLAHDVPEETRVVRTRGLELPTRLPWRVRNWVTSWILTVDAQIGWLPFAVRRGQAVVRQKGVDLLYSTSAPYTDHLVALRLKQQFNLPWVADFRDPWVENFALQFATRWHRNLCNHLERNVVHSADRVLVVSEPMRQQFLRRYPELPPAHFYTLPNGFDRADYMDVTPQPLGAQRFNLVYSGTLYGRRSGRSVLAASAQALRTGQLDAERFCLWLIGATGKEAAQLVQEWGLKHIVKQINYMPHNELTGYQMGADALLLIVGAGPGSEIVLTGKIFEYLAVGKPILALAPPGAAADLITEARAGSVVEPNDVSAITEKLVQMYEAWCSGTLHINPDANVVRRYERRRLTGQLAHLFDELSVRRT